MNRNLIARRLVTSVLGTACLTFGLAAVPVVRATTADLSSIKGTCVFGGKKSTWSAKLTPKGDGTYDAVYDSSWGGKPIKYVGTIKTDGKTEISGTGKASGGGANGTFEFSGTYGDDGIAKCSYKEVGGSRGRKGTLTAELPKTGAEEPAAPPPAK